MTERIKAEQMLLAGMMVSRADTQQIVQLPDFSYSLFEKTGLADFAKALVKAYSAGDSPDITSLIAACEGRDGEYAGGAADMAESISFPLATAKDCIMTIKKSELDARIRELTALIDEETDPDRRRQFQKEQSDLIIKSRSIR